MQTGSDYSDDYEPESDTDLQPKQFYDSGADYSDDFELSRHVDELLSQLASEERLPSQIDDIRHGLASLSRTLATSEELNPETLKVVVSKGHQLDHLLEQLEMELIEHRRKQVASDGKKRKARKASKMRASGRRVEYKHQLAKAQLRATAAEMQKVAIDQRLTATKAQLKKSEKLLQLSQEVKLNLEKCTMLKDGEIADLKGRSSRIAAASALVNQKLVQKVKEAEEAIVGANIQRDVDVAMLRSTLDASERKHHKILDLLSGWEKMRGTLRAERYQRRKQELDTWKLELVRYHVQVETEHIAQDEHIVKVRSRLERQQHQRMQERVSLMNSHLLEKEANERQQGLLACLQSSLDAERSAIARDRTVLESAKSKLLLDLADFTTGDNHKKNPIVTKQSVKFAICQKQSLVASQVAAIRETAEFMRR